MSVRMTWNKVRKTLVVSVCINAAYEIIVRGPFEKFVDWR